MFVDSARRIRVAPHLWLYRDAGDIVGHMGGIAVRMKIGDEERPTAWLVDTMVLESHRNGPIGSHLMVAAQQDLPFALSLGQTAEMREILVRLGWHAVAPLQTAQLLIRPERVLDGKLPTPAAWLAGIGMRATSAARDLIRDRADVQVREIGRFDASHDALWNKMAADVACAVVRDASYLNWKYVDQPGQRFLRLEIMDGSGSSGVAILMFRDPDHAYRYRRAFLVDIVAPLSNTGLMEQIVRAAATAAADRGADALVCLHIHGGLTRVLERCGFRMRTPTRHLVVSVDSLSAATREKVIDGDAWLVTQGDSDIDRPGQ